MSLLAYSFASGITLITLGAVYMIAQRNTTLFALNRACLLAILLASLILPLISLPEAQPVKSFAEAGGLTFVSAGSAAEAPSAGSAEVIKIIGAVYLIGVALMAARTVANIIFILYLRLQSRKLTVGEHTVRAHKHRRIQPMTWGGEIYIAESLLSEVSAAELEMILTHEDAHRRRYHWADLLLSNAALAINWYNPAAWMMQRELIAVHEYEADRIAADHSGDQMNYQLLLIKKTAGSRFQAIADSLNHSSLKKRITMMMKNQSKRSARLRSLALLPAVAVALLVSNSSCVKNAQDSVGDTNSDAAVSEISLKNSDITIRPGDKAEAALVIIDGEESTMEALKALDPSQIASLAIENDEQTLASYGDRAAGGLIIVNTTSSTAGKTQPTAIEETKVVAYGGENPAEETVDIARVAQYPGGMEALYKTLAEKINFTGDLNESGKVIVQFTIDEEGNIVNPHIVRGLSEAKNNEALRVVKELGKWEPAVSTDGKKVACKFTLPIAFKSVAKPATSK